ncbi:hypothetical protein PJ985_06055 [Streptomyces sp. ACA25]|uniref:hypothetical protein n=1 Tax=Streptomyces sp. ACA25 TaxID=3022596 RepID=UPI002307A4DF|nr:hypothetical protein [Streptomyces sp. ACA25]MDB1087130.1 hypothetical protein [Streptomyces sp. ACA25]
MIRNLLGSLAALAGAVTAVLSPFRPWYDGRPGREIAFRELLSDDGLTGTEADLFGGLFLITLGAGILALLAVLSRSRLLAALAGCVVLGVSGLWMARQYQLADQLVVGRGGLEAGALSAVGGGLLLWCGAWLMTGRRAAEPSSTPTPEAAGGSVIEGRWPAAGPVGEGSPPGFRRDAA